MDYILIADFQTERAQMGVTLDGSIVQHQPYFSFPIHVSSVLGSSCGPCHRRLAMLSSSRSMIFAVGSSCFAAKIVTWVGFQSWISCIAQSAASRQADRSTDDAARTCHWFGSSEPFLNANPSDFFALLDFTFNDYSEYIKRVPFLLATECMRPYAPYALASLASYHCTFYLRGFP